MAHATTRGINTTLRSLQSEQVNLKSIITETIWSAKETTELIEDTDDKNSDEARLLEDHKNELRETMKQAVTKLQKVHEAIKYLETAANVALSRDPEERFKELMEFNEATKVNLRGEVPDSANIENDENFVKFLKALKEFDAPENDEGLEVVGDADAYPKKCPVTQQKIENPVFLPCNHIFDHAGINVIMKGIQPFKCPQAGCNFTFTRSQVKVHEEMKTKLARDRELES